jgi:hypothetical protein
MPNDGAGEAAAEAAKKLRAEAEGQLRDRLAERARARKAERELEGKGKVKARSKADWLAEAVDAAVEKRRPPGPPVYTGPLGQGGPRCAGCGRPCGNPNLGGRIMGEEVCGECAHAIGPYVLGGGAPDYRATDALRAIHRRRRKAAERGYGTAGDVAAEELGGGPAPRRSSGGHVLAVDTVQITSRSSPYGHRMAEAAGNCAICGQRWTVPVMLNPYDLRSSSTAPDIAQRAADHLRQVMASAPCPALGIRP